MDLPKRVEDAIVLLVGIYFIRTALTSKTLISESDMPATEEERARAKATRMRRVFFVCAGLALCVYGIIRLLR